MENLSIVLDILGNTYLVGYLVIGFVFSLILDTIIRYTKSSEPFTFGEMLATGLLWPFMLLYGMHYILKTICSSNSNQENE